MFKSLCLKSSHFGREGITPVSRILNLKAQLRFSFFWKFHFKVEDILRF